MLRISANLAKRVPIPGVEYSSQQFSCGLEVEAAANETPEAIRDRIRRVFELLRQEVDQQVRSASGQTPSGDNGNGNSDRRNSRPRTSNGNGRRVPATKAQAKALYAICKDRGLDLDEALATYRVTDASELSVKEASQLIDHLKSQQ